MRIASSRAHYLIPTAIWILIAASVHAQSSPVYVGNPANVSYGVIWNLIQTYEDVNIPDDLGSRFDGYQFSVGIGVDEQGHVCGCGDQPILRRRPTEKALHVSEAVLRRLAASVCPSIETWKFRKFRPFLLDGRPRAFFGPVVFNIERLRFVLADIDPRYQHNSPTVRRRSRPETN